MARMRRFFPAAALVWICAWAAAYAPAVDAPFLWDDHRFITENPAVTGGADLRTFLTDPGALSPDPRYNRAIYRPLRSAGFSLQYRWFGERPALFRAFSLFLHFLSALLVAALLRELGRLSGFARNGSPAAWALAGLWLVHPAHTEAVSFVSSQGDLWVAVSVLAGANLLVRAYRTRRTGPPVVFLYLLSLVFALLSKETAVVAFLAHGGLVRSLPADPIRNKIERVVVAVGLPLSAAYLAVRFELLGRMTQIDGAAASMGLNLVTEAPKTLLSYFALLFWPSEQRSVYSAVRWNGLEPFLGLAAAAVFLGACVRARRAGNLQAILRSVGCGVLWFAAFLAPISNVVPISIPFAERFVYLPSIGIAVALFPVVTTLRLRSGVAWGAATSLAAALSILSFERNRLWSDELELMRESVVRSPDSVLARRNFIQALYERGHYAGAAVEIAAYERRWPLTREVGGVKMEAACRRGLWPQCLRAAVPVLRDPVWADRAAYWVLASEARTGSTASGREIRRKYCGRFPGSPVCGNATGR